MLATAASLPVPDPEAPALAAALRARGADASVESWDSEADWATADLVVVRSAWDYFARIDEFLRWADAVDAVTRLANSADVVRWNSRKAYLVALADAGVPVVPTTVIARGETADLGVLDGLGSEVVVKPEVSAAAIGAVRGRPHDPEVVAHIRDLATRGHVLIQPLIHSVLDRGETSLVYLGGAFSHAVRTIPRQGEFRGLAHHGGTVVTHRPSAEELRVAQLALAAAPGPHAYARVDLVASESGPLLMELELIEPWLFLADSVDATARFADVLIALAAPSPGDTV